MSRKKAAFGQQLREALADGVVSDAESETLERLKRQYRLSDDAVKSMMDEVRAELDEKNKKTWAWLSLTIPLVLVSSVTFIYKHITLSEVSLW